MPKTKKRELNLVCPRCGHLIPNDAYPGRYPGALSRWDSKTEVCSDCGQDEAMLQFMYRLIPSKIKGSVHPTEGERPWVTPPPGL